MFAIVEISGEQFKIDKSTKTLRVPYMKDAKAGDKVNFDNVLIGQSKDGKVALGGTVKVSATVTGEVRGEKLIVFKKKRRKGYRTKNGHQQSYTELQIENFSV